VKGKLAMTGLALMLGVAAGAVGRSALAPVAEAQASKRYQHYCLNLKWADVDGKQLRPDMGKQGWELATLSIGGSGVARIVACFKREVTR
jgi:hypothetical protein